MTATNSAWPILPEQVSRVTAVVYNAEDARRLLDSGISFDAALPLTPSARAELRRAGVCLIDQRSIFSDHCFAEGMKRLQIVQRRLVDALAGRSEIRKATRWLLQYALHGVFNSAVRLNLTLEGEGPWVVVDGGQVRTVTDRSDVELALLQRLRAYYTLVDGWHTYNPPPLPGLYRAMRRLLIKVVRQHPSIVTQRSDHPFGLRQQLETSNPPVRIFHVTRAELGWKEYLKLGRELIRSLMGERFIQIRALSDRCDATEMVEFAASSTGDAIFERAILTLGDDLAHSVSVVNGIVGDMTEVVRDLRPDVFLSYEMADGFSAALAEACGVAGVPRLVMNHNSHSSPHTSIDAIAMEHFFTIQYVLDLTDEFIMWTPKAAAVARQHLPQSRWKNIRPFARPVQGRTSERKADHSMRYVLHASNAQRWMHFFPWVFETTDEFVDGLASLVNAIAEVPNSHLTVRVKARRYEMPQDDLLALVPPAAHWDLRWRVDYPFADDLRQADLLVCGMSTTIMQALHARKPVLLWGGTLRYRHLEARMTLPTRDDRSAVYTVNGAEELAPMIAAILDAHAGEPLTDAEVAPYVWPEGTPGGAELAAALARGDYRTTWPAACSRDAQS